MPSRGPRRRRHTQRPNLPIRWAELDHGAHEQRIKRRLSLAAVERAAGDASRSVLEARLYALNQAEHIRYVESQLATILEELRATRDVYCENLREFGLKPSAELRWVVFRFAVVPRAVRLVRAAACRYLSLSKIEPARFVDVYSPTSNLIAPLGPELNRDTVRTTELLIAALVDEDAFKNTDPVRGPFSALPDSFQLRRLLGVSAIEGSVFTVNASEGDYRRRWESNCPWTECLHLLFACTQQELFAQYDALHTEGNMCSFFPLDPFERIALAHLQDMRTLRVNRRFGDERWLRLVQELDREKIPLDQNLSALELRVLVQAGQKHKIATWQDAYDSKSAIRLPGRDKVYRLKQIIKQAIQNAAQRAEAKNRS